MLAAEQDKSLHGERALYWGDVPWLPVDALVSALSF